MFDHDDEDKDLESQVDKFGKGNSAQSAREGTPGPQSSTAQVTESPSSVQTEKSESDGALKDSGADKKPIAEPLSTASNK